MNRRSSIMLVLLLVLSFSISAAQEFPIAVGSENTFGGGGAFDGTNFLFAIRGDAANQYTLGLQFVSTTGSLVGPRIPLGYAGSNPQVAFDGMKYMIAWTDSFPAFASGDTNGIGNVYGQFVGTSGTLIGSRFTIATGVNAKWGQGRGLLTYADTTFLVLYVKGPDHHHDIMYGQRIGRDGSFIGSPFQISEGYARECAIAHDGSKYLVAWCRVDHPLTDKTILGQFVSPAGTLIGTNFVIDDSDNASDNPVSMTYDGTKYWVGYHDQAADTSDRWNLFGRFVSTTGVVSPRFIICDSTKDPSFTSAAFDGTNYLMTWMEFAPQMRVAGRFFNASGIPIDTAFTAFGSIGNKVPLGGVGGFVDGKFLLTATRTGLAFTDGDLYGLFLPGSTTDVTDDSHAFVPGGTDLGRNYPNPFNPTTNFGMRIAEYGMVRVSIHDILGREVAVLVNEVKAPGSYTVMWNAGGMTSGVYYYQLRTGMTVMTKQMVLVR
ncbi:MAG: T9SS type A sorting domain-containing protein [Bacteroidetes bacterium]|nr:T9SS type A sorting domain-containing protein [Bacteroidota bacterium]